MPNTPFWDKVFSRTSWVLVLLLLFSAISIWAFAQPGPGPGQPIASALGVFVAKTFYTSLYTLQAALLAFSKWRKKKRMRKYVLMFIYLTGFFTSILAIFAYGWDARLIDNVLVACTAAVCWLYWTFKTEYISPDEFDKTLEELRDDLPPSTKE